MQTCIAVVVSLHLSVVRIFWTGDFCSQLASRCTSIPGAALLALSLVRACVRTWNAPGTRAVLPLSSIQDDIHACTHTLMPQWSLEYVRMLAIEDEERQESLNNAKVSWLLFATCAQNYVYACTYGVRAARDNIWSKSNLTGRRARVRNRPGNRHTVHA